MRLVGKVNQICIFIAIITIAHVQGPLANCEKDRIKLAEASLTLEVCALPCCFVIILTHLLCCCSMILRATGGREQRLH